MHRRELVLGGNFYRIHKIKHWLKQRNTRLTRDLCLLRFLVDEKQDDEKEPLSGQAKDSQMEGRALTNVK